MSRFLIRGRTDLVVNIPLEVSAQYGICIVSLEGCNWTNALWAMIESGRVKDNLCHCQVLFSQRSFSLREVSSMVRGPWIIFWRGMDSGIHLSYQILIAFSKPGFQAIFGEKILPLRRIFYQIKEWLGEGLVLLYFLNKFVAHKERILKHPPS